MTRFAIGLALALVATTATRAHADDPKIPLEKYKLPNGLEVILVPDQSTPLIAVNIWYHVGSGDEVPDRSGFAHLFEHMMFQGTKNTREDAHFKVLRSVGSDQINGSTNSDRTNYFEVVPSNQLETALWLESERMSHLLPALTKASLDNQIDVVRNERRQSYDNRPYTRATFAMYAALYPEGHPYRYLTIGKHEDLECASVEDVKHFYETWYVPANATLVLAGDFDAAAAKLLVTKWFGSFPASQKPKVVTVPAPTVAAQTITVDDSFAKLRQITFAWHSPGAYADGDAELDIVANALGAEGTGRLYKSLVYDKQLAQMVRVDQDGMTFSGVFSITVQLRTGANLEAVERIVRDEVAKVAHENLTDQELARVVANREASTVYRLENLNNRANLVQGYNHFLGDPSKLTWDLDRFRNASANKIKTTVATYLSPTHEITIVTNPSTTKLPPTAKATCGGGK